MDWGGLQKHISMFSFMTLENLLTVQLTNTDVFHSLTVFWGRCFLFSLLMPLPLNSNSSQLTSLPFCNSIWHPTITLAMQASRIVLAQLQNWKKNSKRVHSYVKTKKIIKQLTNLANQKWGNILNEWWIELLLN